MTFVYTDGECSTNLEVKSAASEETKPTEEGKTDTAAPTESVKDTSNSDTLSGAESPKTGDEFNLALCLSLSIISLAGLAFTLKYKKSQF